MPDLDVRIMSHHALKYQTETAHFAALRTSSSHPSTVLMRQSNLIIELLINGHAKLWMLQIPRLQDIFYRSFSRPLVDTCPDHALMRTGKISQGYSLRSTPPHRQWRGISMTHDALAQYVDAVFVVIAIVFFLLIGEIREIVGRVHVAMKAFLVVWISLFGISGE